MEQPPTVTPPLPRTWKRNLPHVRKALAFIRQRGAVTAAELVEWDFRHGRRLFTWDQDKAADEYRMMEARFFLNSFRARFDGMRVRAFIHVREDESRQIDRDAYCTIESISQHQGMREQVIENVTKRMESLAAELRMWRLTRAEVRVVFRKLWVAINGKVNEKNEAA